MEIQGAFDSLCKILFGSEIGKLGDFEEYLKEPMIPYNISKSSISGKDVRVASTYDLSGRKLISQDEIKKVKLKPLNVDDIKDIDSLFEAVGENFNYCGNKLFGKNYSVELVDNCTDCYNVIHSHNVYNVKHGAYLSYVREAEYVFGLGPHPYVKFAMRSCEGLNCIRCFETYYSSNVSDTYYAFNCISCQSCMFCFNQRNTRNAIGNLELTKERYAELKSKLTEEMASELRRKKKLPSIADIAFIGIKKPKEDQLTKDSPVPERLEKAFSSTCKIVLGKQRNGMGKFSGWLEANKGLGVKKVKGAFGSPTYKMTNLPIVRDIPSERLVTQKEGVKCGEKKIEIDGPETPSFSEIAKRASKIAYFTLEFVDGPNVHCYDTPSVFTGSYIYKCWDTTRSKNSAYVDAAIESEYVFGGNMRILRSEFCLRCSDVSNSKKCFEVASSHSTRDSYFCFNVESCSDCILCFNEKGLSYAVGNTKVGKEQYSRIKGMLLDYLNKELDKNSGVPIGVYRLPMKKK